MKESWIEMVCAVPCAVSRAAAEARQRQLTKPPGSLGVLETLAIRLASLQATDRPRAALVPIVLFAGDHGITAQGVSAYPSDVTVQMLCNFAGGGAAIAVLARQLGSALSVSSMPARWRVRRLPASSQISRGSERVIFRKSRR